MSDKASISTGIAALFPDRDVRTLLNSSLVYDLLGELSRVRGAAGDGPRRAYFADRQTVPFSRIKDRIGRQAARVVIHEFVRARLLLRGAVLQCPVCQLKRWYPLDRVTEAWRCDGCGQETRVPLDPNTTTWTYRINELCAIGFDQGAVTPINVMLKLAWNAAVNRDALLGYYPGVIIKGRPGADVPTQTAEIDVVAIVNGRLTIAECKESGTDLGDGDGDGLSFTRLGSYLGAERVIFATAGMFSASSKATCLDDAPAVEWWERSELLDRYGPAARSTTDDASPATSYLRALVERLVSAP